jgi:hypothetical protein
MCLACEQDAIWLAYLDSQGMLKPDDPDAVEKFFADFPVQPLPGQSLSEQALPGQSEWDSPTPEAPAKPAPKPAAKNPFSCDDPTGQ